MGERTVPVYTTEDRGHGPAVVFEPFINDLLTETPVSPRGSFELNPTRSCPLFTNEKPRSRPPSHRHSTRVPTPLRPHPPVAPTLPQVQCRRTDPESRPRGPTPDPGPVSTLRSTPNPLTGSVPGGQRDPIEGTEWVWGCHGTAPGLVVVTTVVGVPAQLVLVVRRSSRLRSTNPVPVLTHRP